jgi:hypothetical protein
MFLEMIYSPLSAMLVAAKEGKLEADQWGGYFWSITRILVGSQQA